MILDLSINQNNHDYWEELREILVKNSLSSEKIKEAFDFAYKAHEGQHRDSGELYISHLSWVAKLIAQMEIGEEPVIAALLHDSLKKTPVTIEEIDEKFGDEVALLVAGLSEVQDKTTGKKVDNTNVEIFRKFLFSSVDDVRILIIRLADKLHNGITIESIPRDKQIEYAKRVMGIYAPIAEYVGLHYFKKRLDDIAFKILYPEEANNLVETFKKHEKDEIKASTLIGTEIEEMLKINNINNCEIQGRIKSLYSTYLKIKKKGVENIGDRVGIRILTDTVSSCYTILGLLHARYNYLPDEFDDYISTPKPNGYRLITKIEEVAQPDESGEDSLAAQLKAELEVVNTKISSLESVLENFEIISGNNKSSTVQIGSKVRMKILGNSERTFYVVGEFEADPSSSKISSQSPLGLALMGKKVNDKFEVDAPAGKLTYKIVAIA